MSHNVRLWMLNQQFSKNSDFPCGVLTRRPDDEHTARRDRVARHHLDEGAGIQKTLDEVIRKPSDAEPRDRSSGGAVPLSALNRPCG